MSKRKGVGGGLRIKFDESKHRRGVNGQFVDKPGAGDDAPKDLKSAGINGDDVIVDLGGNKDLDGVLVRDFVDGHPDGAEAALYELTAGHKFGVVGFRGAPNAKGFSLDDAGRAAILDYTAAGYRPMNAQLRGFQPATEAVKGKVAALDRALDGARLPEPVTVYRGVGSLGVQTFQSQGLRKGGILTDPAFMSTSTNSATARAFAQNSRTNVTMEIRAPKGAKALNVSAFSDAPGESEVLFARGVRMKVVSFSKPKNLLVVEVLND